MGDFRRAEGQKASAAAMFEFAIEAFVERGVVGKLQRALPIVDRFLAAAECRVDVAGTVVVSGRGGVGCGEFFRSFQSH